MWCSYKDSTVGNQGVHIHANLRKSKSKTPFYYRGKNLSLVDFQNFMEKKNDVLNVRIKLDNERVTEHDT